MTLELSRREFLKSSSAIAGMVATTGIVAPLTLQAAGKKPQEHHVVVIGGGFGGATCAKYLKKFDASIKVTLIEMSDKFVTCPFSNLVLGGIRDIQSITHSYDGLRDKHGVEVVLDEVVEVDGAAAKVKTKSGKQFSYDRLVVSPGIDFIWNTIEGYDEAAVQSMPHAWKAGEQTLLLRKQIEAMDNGGVLVIVAPANPFRCPPGPYERASMIAHYFKQHKPKSKIIIMDAKDNFSKEPLFRQGWEALYPGMIEWVGGTKGGRVTKVDVASNTVFNEVGDPIKASVVNLVPPQNAGAIASKAGLTDSGGWCPINQKTFESTLQKNVYVIGDASMAGVMPKSGFSANTQAKVCAAAVVTGLQGAQLPDPSYSNTCYSLLGPDYGISVAAVYKVMDNKIEKVEGSGGVSPIDGGDSFRRAEALYASGWYCSMMQDIFN